MEMVWLLEAAQAGDAGPAISLDFVLVLRINEISCIHLSRHHDFCMGSKLNALHAQEIDWFTSSDQGAASFNPVNN